MRAFAKGYKLGKLSGEQKAMRAEIDGLRADIADLNDALESERERSAQLASKLEDLDIDVFVRWLVTFIVFAIALGVVSYGIARINNRVDQHETGASFSLGVEVDAQPDLYDDPFGEGPLWSDDSPPLEGLPFLTPSLGEPFGKDNCVTVEWYKDGFSFYRVDELIDVTPGLIDSLAQVDGTTRVEVHNQSVVEVYTEFLSPKELEIIAWDVYDLICNADQVTEGVDA